MNLFSYLKTRISILDVVSEYATLKKAGLYWKGQCPFHAEKTASFTVSPHKEIFYCFGCHVGGDVISFIARIEQCGQLESAKLLIEKYQIELPEFLENELTSGIKQNNIQIKKHFETCAAFANWCHAQLLKSTKPYAYLSKRLIKKESIVTFTIGYLPGGATAIKRMCSDLAKEHILIDDLIQAHILSRSKNVLFSPFEERILFPITDHLGRFCGFGGRIFNDGDTRPKYYNSSESPYFIKGDLLFGLNLAKKEIQKTNSVFLVEGYTDCVAMAQAGYKNSVATLGTACNKEHLQTVARFAQKLFVLYDGDNAGQQAILRIGQLSWQANLDLHVIRLPNGEDPASFLMKNKDLEIYINKAQDIFSFFIETVTHDFTHQTLAAKLELIRKILQMIAHIQDPLKKDILLHSASKRLEISYPLLVKELAKLTPNKSSSRPNKQEQVGGSIKDSLVEKKTAGLTISDDFPLENKIFFAIMSNIQLLNKENEEFLITYLPYPLCDILKKIHEAKKINLEIGFLQLYEMLNPEHQQLVSRVLLAHQEDIAAPVFAQLYLQLQKKHWKAIVNDIKHKLQEAREAGNQKEIDELTQEFMLLKRKFVGRIVPE